MGGSGNPVRLLGVHADGSLIHLDDTRDIVKTRAVAYKMKMQRLLLVTYWILYDSSSV